MRNFVLCLTPVFLFIVSACGVPATEVRATLPLVTSTAEPDPCSPENLPVTVQEVNELMREFDTASQSAANISAQQLPDLISNLQRIRRGAQDVQIPSCLGTLKTHQLNHMELMIQTLMALMGGSNQETVQNGLQMARQEHTLYDLELLRLLGATLAPRTPTPAETISP